MEIGQCFGQILDRNEEEMLHRPRRSLDCRRREWGLPVRWVDDPVDARRFGSSQQGAEVLGVLERIEDEHERRLLPFDGTRQDVLQAGELPPVRDQRDPLVAVEAGQRCQGATFDLHDRDPEVGGVQDQLLERLATLRHHEQPMSLATGDERLLDGVPAGDEFLVLPEQVARRRVGRRPLPVGRLRTARAVGPSVDGAAGATPVVRPWRGPWRGHRCSEARFGAVRGPVVRRGVERLAGRGLLSPAGRGREAPDGQIGAG